MSVYSMVHASVGEDLKIAGATARGQKYAIVFSTKTKLWQEFTNCVFKLYVLTERDPNT